MSRSEVLCLTAIVALATFFLAPALRPGYTLLPLGLQGGIAPWHKQVTKQAQNLLLSDPFYTFYPRRHFFTASIQQGVYPLWNPYVFSGHPAMGDTAAQTFYPPNLVAAIFLPAARALPVLAWFHLTLTGLATFVFLRLLRLRPGPALFGATAWMLNGNAIVWLENPHRLSTLAWLPVILLLYEAALQRRRNWPGYLAGLLYGFSILGGHTQFALGNGIVLAAYGALRAASLSRQEGRFVGRPLALVLIVGLMGVGTGAVQLLPTLQLTSMSHRHIGSVGAFLSSHWPTQHLVGLWIPDFYGNPVRPPYWGQLNYAEVTAYYGAFAVPLALFALVRSRRDTGKALAALHIVTLLVALGTPLTWLVAWLPATRYFRLVSLIAYIPFFGSTAAAFGLDGFVHGDERNGSRKWAIILATLATLVGTTVLIVWLQRAGVATHETEVSSHLWRTGAIWLVGMACLLLERRRHTVGVALLVILLAVDLIQWGQPFNPVNSTDILYPENEVTTTLRSDASIYRVLPLHTDRVIFGPNVLSVLGFQEIGGYSSLMTERYRQLVKAIDDEIAIWWMKRNQNILASSHFDPLFSMLNVKYVLATHPLHQHLTSVEVTYPAGPGPGAPLTTGEQVKGSFCAVRPGLNRVDVELRRTGSGPPDSVRFRLWRDQIDGELVADITVEGSNLPEEGAYPFFFSPTSDSANATFAWAVEAPAAGKEATVEVLHAENQPPQRTCFRRIQRSVTACGNPSRSVGLRKPKRFTASSCRAPCGDRIGWRFARLADRFRLQPLDDRPFGGTTARRCRGCAYTLSVGMYDYPSGVRLPAVEPADHQLPENRIVLQEVDVASPK